jgi:hypothetical protein
MKTAEIELVQWLNKNIHPKTTRKLRSTQLYILGAKEVGKTHLISELRKYLRIYDMPRFENFDSLYEDGMYDLVVVDEFKGNRPVQFMNSFLDGSPLMLRKKGSQYLKTDNLPVMICSNYSLTDAYKNLDADYLESLQSRLLTVYIPDTQRLDIQFIQSNENVHDDVNNQ